MTLSVDADFIRATLAQLVRINSINPLLDPSSPGENEIAESIAGTLRDLGLDTALHDAESGRTSVTGVLAGSGGGRSLMLNGHIDTVGVEGMHDPFGAQIRDGRLYGRGSYDMKGAVAACIGAVKAIVDAGLTPAGDIVVAGVADEEYSSIGTQSVIAARPVDAAIVTEPTHLQVCLAHKGYVWTRVTTGGRAAHGSRFEEGIDANLRMGRVLAGLADLERRVRTGATHALVGPGSLHAAMVRGGTGISTYASQCELHIERRTIPGETGGQVDGEIAAMLDAVRRDDPDLEVSHETYFVREPFEVAADAGIVQVVDRAVERVTARPPRHVGDTPWMDAALLQEAGVETVVIGPGGAGAHAAEEWVDVQSVVDLAEVLARAAIDYCGGGR